MGRVQLHAIRIAALLPGLLIVVFATGATAQHFERRRSDGNSGLGLGLLLVEPRGEFADYVGSSLGLGGYVHLDLDKHSPLGLRLEGSMVYYGSETTTQSFFSGPELVYGDVTIRNRIGSLFIGPQLNFGSGAVRPYVHGGVGFSYFWTGTDFEHSYYDCYDCGNDLDIDLFFEGETDYSHWTGAWNAGGGVRVALARWFSVYFALQYMNNGRVTYLREGSIIDHGDGYYSFTPIESEANMLVAQFGFAFQ